MRVRYGLLGGKLGLDWGLWAGVGWHVGVVVLAVRVILAGS